jgi:hypothetical protein
MIKNLYIYVDPFNPIKAKTYSNIQDPFYPIEQHSVRY